MLDDAMNGEKPSRTDWNNVPREELLSELARLQAENTRLATLLPVRVSSQPEARQPAQHASPPRGLRSNAGVLSPQEKVRLFRQVFRGRTDVYPLRWESRVAGKSGYAPACANEWRAGICEKPRIRCADCGHRVLLPVDDQIIYAHLAGEHTVGLYPLMPNGTCYLLAVDFDEEGWREDATAFRQSCRELGVAMSQK